MRGPPAFLVLEESNTAWQRGGTGMVIRYGLLLSCLLVGGLWLDSPEILHATAEEMSPILTVLPKDAIPAELTLRFRSGAEATEGFA